VFPPYEGSIKKAIASRPYIHRSNDPVILQFVTSIAKGKWHFEMKKSSTLTIQYMEEGCRKVSANGKLTGRVKYSSDFSVLLHQTVSF
jgi:hypothetical protein